MPVGLGAQLAKVREVVAALTPTTTGSGAATGFTSTVGTFAPDLPIEDDPQIADRYFEAVPSDEPPENTQHTSTDAYFLGRYSLWIAYDTQGDRVTGAARIAEDEEQIVTALERSTNYATGVLVNRRTGGGTERSGDTHFVRRRIDFECLYFRTI